MSSSRNKAQDETTRGLCCDRCLTFGTEKLMNSQIEKVPRSTRGQPRESELMMDLIAPTIQLTPRGTPRAVVLS